MKCPICDHPRVPDGALRCPNCQSALTTWLNWNDQARKAHRAGLHALAQADPNRALEWLLRAILFAPEEPDYLDACGRVLGQLGRHEAAALLLQHACELRSDAASLTARDRARVLARAVSGVQEA